jgi:hypothetical protein
VPVIWVTCIGPCAPMRTSWYQLAGYLILYKTPQIKQDPRKRCAHSQFVLQKLVREAKIGFPSVHPVVTLALQRQWGMMEAPGADGGSVMHPGFEWSVRESGAYHVLS